MNSEPIEKKSQVTALLDEAYACRINDLKRSTELAGEALRLSREMDDKGLTGKCLSMLSLFTMIMGEHEASMSMSQEAIGYFEELKDEKGIADAKYSIAGIYYKTDNYHLGLVYLIDCLTTYRKYHDYHNQARVQKYLGTIYEYFGDQKNAVKSYESAIDAARLAEDLNLESNAYNPLSGIYLNLGEIEKAEEIIEKSIAIKKQTGDTRGLAFALYGRGKIFVKTGNYKEAEADFLEALRIHQSMGERLGSGMVYYKLAALYVNMGLIDKAKETLQTALEFSTAHNIVIAIFNSHYLLYEIYKKENNPEKALESLEKYLTVKEAVINTQTLKIIENYELLNKMELIEKEAQVQLEKAEIIEKKNRAEQAAQVKQEFLSTMSHEIRTPLNAVLTIASLLSEKSDREDKQLLDSLKFAGNNLLLIINDILDFTKLDSGKVQLELRPGNIKLLLENIKNTYASLAREKGLTLSLHIDSDINKFYELDETKISQILGNLITNAIKFTDEGRVELIVEMVKQQDDTDDIKFSIKDSGIGISEVDREEIFVSFFQPKSITTKKHGGSGLGLAIVKKLLALFGSTIHLESKLGTGSTFYFELSLQKSNSPDNIISKPSNFLKGKTVLLAEDNMVNAMVAVKLLSNWEVTTVHAKNGLEAIDKSRLKAYDFILMDIHMPEMDGFEATKQIRKSLTPNKDTPIFALTADITAEHQQEYNTYFNGFLRKPIEIDKLYAALIGV
ncbi:MAG: ATP-binding protein [Bacteroidota bacterium]|nr:ATP-binding protein [Bacteroidota bacterium]